MLGTSDHNIEVGVVAEVRYVCGFLWMALPFEEPDEDFFRVLLTVIDLHVDVDHHTHTAMQQHQFLKLTRCQSMRSFNL